MRKNIVSIALAVCMIGTTVPVAAADFTDVPAVENNSEFSDETPLILMMIMWTFLCILYMVKMVKQKK